MLFRLRLSLLQPFSNRRPFISVNLPKTQTFLLEASSGDGMKDHLDPAYFRAYQKGGGVTFLFFAKLCLLAVTVQANVMSKIKRNQSEMAFFPTGAEFLVTDQRHRVNVKIFLCFFISPFSLSTIPPSSMMGGECVLVCGQAGACWEMQYVQRTVMRTDRWMM